MCLKNKTETAPNISCNSLSLGTCVLSTGSSHAAILVSYELVCLCVCWLWGHVCKKKHLLFLRLKTFCCTNFLNMYLCGYPLAKMDPTTHKFVPGMNNAFAHKTVKLVLCALRNKHVFIVDPVFRTLGNKKSEIFVKWYCCSLIIPTTIGTTY